MSGPPGQIIESVNDTFKGQLDLERHGGHIPDGVLPRVLQRILAPTAICHNDPAASLSCVQRGGRSIKVMNGDASPARAAGFPPGWARWSGLAAFIALVAVGLARMNPSPLVAVAAAVVAAGAGVLLAQQRRPLLVYAAVATGGIAVLGHGLPSNVSWFAVCLLGAWCVLTGSRRDGLVYWAAAMALFAAEWLWVKPDPGWGAWMAGTTLSVLGGLLVRHEVNLVAQLRAAQAGLAERARAEERNRIARELHDVIAHTLTVMLLHVTSARLLARDDAHIGPQVELPLYPRVENRRLRRRRAGWLRAGDPARGGGYRLPRRRTGPLPAGSGGARGPGDRPAARPAVGPLAPDEPGGRTTVRRAAAPCHTLGSGCVRRGRCGSPPASPRDPPARPRPGRPAKVGRMATRQGPRERDRMRGHPGRRPSVVAAVPLPSSPAQHRR